MIWPQNTKTVPLLSAGTLATNATATAIIDTLGYDYATIEVAQGNSVATNSSAKWAVLAITESDLTVYSNATSITGLTGTTNTSTTSGFVIQPNNSTSTGLVHKFQIALNGRKRYLFLGAQPHATNNAVYAKAELTRAEQAPDTDTERNIGLTVIA